MQCGLFLYLCVSENLIILKYKFFWESSDWNVVIVVVQSSVMSDSLWLHGLQHTKLPCPSPSPWACSNSCPLSQWCHPTISSSAIPFPSCLQSFLASGSFLMSQLFASVGQSTGAAPSSSVLSVKIQGWFPLELTGMISMLSKGLSRIFSSKWLLEKP